MSNVRPNLTHVKSVDLAQRIGYIHVVTCEDNLVYRCIKT